MRLLDATIYPFFGFAQPCSSLSHLLAALVFACASPFLVRLGRGDAGRTVGLWVFAVSCVLLLSLSGVYHWLAEGSHARAVFHRLDYAAIYCLIAGSFTGVHATTFRGAWRWGMIAVVWGIATVGITLTLVFFRELPEWVSLGGYLGMGWIGLVSSWKVWRAHGWALIQPLLVGGGAYSLGAVLEFFRVPVLVPRVVGPHEVFHMAVILGISCHWLFMRRSAQLLPAR